MRPCASTVSVTADHLRETGARGGHAAGSEPALYLLGAGLCFNERTLDPEFGSRVRVNTV